MNSVPESVEQLVAQREAALEPGEVLGVKESLAEPCGDLQIFGDGGERILRPPDYQRVVGELTLGLPGTLAELVIFAARFANLVVDEQLVVVTKIDAARIIAGNGSEDVFAKRHSGHQSGSKSFYCTGAGGAPDGVNSSERTSRKGNSSPSTSSIFWPEGDSRPSSPAAQSVPLPSQTFSSVFFQENG